MVWLNTQTGWCSEPALNDRYAGFVLVLTQPRRERVIRQKSRVLSRLLVGELGAFYIIGAYASATDELAFRDCLEPFFQSHTGENTDILGRCNLQAAGDERKRLRMS